MMIELLTALHKAKSQFKPIIKSANNPFFKSKYANLDTITDAIKEGLDNNGLIILQPVQGNILHTQIYHAESGEMLESLYNLPDLSDPQKLGSAITYARRYALCSFLGLVADDDDDGNIASGVSNVIDKNQLDKLQKLVMDKKIPKESAKKVVLDFGYTLSSNILKEDFNKVYKEIEALGK